MQSHETIELAFVVLAALALLTQTFILLAMYFGITKGIRSLKEEIDDIRSTVMPTVHDTLRLVERLSPKVESTMTDFAELTHGLRIQAAEFEVVASEVLQRVRKETGRIDGMFSSTLDAVDKASFYVTKAVSKPVRQISGLLASLKAIIESLGNSDQGYRQPVVHDDKDQFV